MKITVSTNKDTDVTVKQKDIFIWVPNFLVLNKTALDIAKKQNGGQYIPDIPTKALREIRKTIKKVKKIHKNWVLVDVESSYGQKVQVKL